MKLTFLAAALAALFFATVVEPAFAQIVSISGTHSRAEIKSKCDAAGGDYHEEHGSQGQSTGYYCGAPSGNGVSCDNKGKCEGFVNAQTTPPPGPVSLGSFIGQAVKTLGKSMSPSPAKPKIDATNANTGGLTMSGGTSEPPTKPSAPVTPVGGLHMG